VIATSIPVFRTLFSEFRSKARSYIRSHSGKSGGGTETYATYATGTKNNTAVTSTRMTAQEYGSNGGDRILSGTIVTVDPAAQRAGHDQFAGNSDGDIELEAMPDSHLDQGLRSHPMDGSPI
jgi:hypothetical protein